MKPQRAMMAVVALIAVLTLIACGGSPGPREAIIGTWQGVEGGDIYSFDRDGKVTINGEEGTYEFLDDSRLHINIQTTHYSSYTWGIKVNGDLLQLTSQSGRIFDYKRVAS